MGLGFFSYTLLNFKREALSIEPSQADADFPLLLPRTGSLFGVLVFIRICCLFGLIWSFIGFNWVVSSGDACDVRIVKVKQPPLHIIMQTIN